MTSPQQPWWSGGVLYQAYPRSFADSNGDGIGELAGLRGRLEYLHWLGVDGIWLNPTFPSPNRDWGYDVSDYFDVHPDLRTLEDLDTLIADARELGIRILLDLVPAHTSDQHEWFVESRSSRESSRRPWYIWTDEVDEQDSVFGGATWTYDERTSQYYHHLFLPEQPRIAPRSTPCCDAGARLRAATSRSACSLVRRGSWTSMSWRASTDAMTNCSSRSTSFMFADLDATALAGVVERADAVLPDGALPVWALSNHDVVRFPTRMCEGDDAKVRCALLALLTLRGTSFLYYGDELGMRHVEISPDRVLDVNGRDGARTPLPWGDVEWRNPWLPLGGDVASVAEQRGDPGSVLSFCRDAIALRRAREDLVSGGYTSLDSPSGVWAWLRGGATGIALNLSDSEATVPLEGEVLLSTKGRDHPSRLEPWEGVVVALT